MTHLNNTLNVENNNMVFATSTPKMVINGNINNDNNIYNNNGNNNTTQTMDVDVIEDIDDTNKMRISEKEKLMNSINANASTNGCSIIGTGTQKNTTTVIADIEDVKKKYKYTSDKTYYIAKEILMTELTYKKDLDVINVVSCRFT